MVLIILDSNHQSKLPYNANTFSDVQPLIERVCEEFGLQPEKWQNYGLFKQVQETFVMQIEDIRKMKDSQSLILRNIPNEAQNTVDRLERSLRAYESTIKSPQIANLKLTAKSIVNQLKTNINNDMFAQMFIDYDGIQKLVLLIIASQGNTQAYALSALINSLFYVSAIEYLKTQPSIIASIYQLIDKEAINTQQQTLGLLYVLAEKMPDGFLYLNAAAKSTAYSMGRAPYASLLDCLYSTDITIKTRSLTLINTMLKNAPSQRQLCKFIARLENLGIFEVLQQIGATSAVNNADFKAQIMNFQLALGIIIPTAGYQSEVHKERIKQLNEHVAKLERKLQKYVEQQNLFQLMSDDLIRFKKLEDLTMERETMLHVFSPLSAYQEEELMSLPMLKSGVVDIKKAVKEKLYAIQKAQKQAVQAKKQAEQLKRLVDITRKEADKMEDRLQGSLKNKRQQLVQAQAKLSNIQHRLNQVNRERDSINVKYDKILKEYEEKIQEFKGSSMEKQQMEGKMKETEQWLQEKGKAVQDGKQKIRQMEQRCEDLVKNLELKEAQLIQITKKKLEGEKLVASQEDQKKLQEKLMIQENQKKLKDQIDKAKNQELEKFKNDLKQRDQKIQKLERAAKDKDQELKRAINQLQQTKKVLQQNGRAKFNLFMIIGSQRGSAIPPIGGASAIPPIGGASAIPPIGGASAIPSIGGASAIPPIGGASAIPPIGGASAIPPIGGASAIPPIGGASAIPPIGGASAIPPIGGASAIPPIGGASAIPPIGGASAIPPIGGASAIPPIGGASAIPPIGGSAIPAIPPIGGSAIPAIPPIGGSAIPAMPPPPMGGSAIPAMPPPPLVGGGIPLPPPPGGRIPPLPGAIGGFLKKIKPNKQKIVPSKKLVALNWKRIIKDKQNKSQKKSIWDKVTQHEFKLQDVEELFAAKVKATTQSTSAPVIVKPEKRKFFDPVLSQKISIVFKRLPPPKTLYNSIQSMDQTTMSRDHIQGLIKAWPESDSLAQLKEEAQSQPQAKWDFAQQYILQVIDLSFVKMKMTQWRFKLQFQQQVDSVLSFFSSFNKGLQCLKQSSFIHTLLATSLGLGNILNGNTDKGQADGFNIQAILRLGMVKDSNGKPALQFVMRTMKNANPDIQNFRADMKPTKIRPNLDDELSAMDILVSGFTACKNQTKTLIQKIKDPKDQFPQVMTTFLQYGQKEIENVLENKKKTLDYYKEVVEYFQIPSKDSKATSSLQFFKFFNQLFDLCEKNMPKEKVARKQHVGLKIAGGGNMSALMKEMQARVNK